MMKRMGIAVLMLLCVLFSACGGDISGVQVSVSDSEVYSDAEIKLAVDTVLKYFRQQFEGCRLTEIVYPGDDVLQDYQDFAERHRAEDVIVLVSSSDVGAAGGDGSLNPNDTYRNWKWILVRDSGGRWRHVDHGY